MGGREFIGPSYLSAYLANKSSGAIDGVRRPRMGCASARARTGHGTRERAGRRRGSAGRRLSARALCPTRVSLDSRRHNDTDAASSHGAPGRDPGEGGGDAAVLHIGSLNCYGDPGAAPLSGSVGALSIVGWWIDGDRQGRARA